MKVKTNVRAGRVIEELPDQPPPPPNRCGV